MLSRTLDRLRLSPGSPGHKKMRLPLLALVFGAMASLSMFVFIKDSIEKEARLRFERQASDARHAIESRFISYANVLYGLAALFSKSGTPSHADFAYYVETLDLARRYPGIWGLNYAEYVRREDKARFVARIRRDTSLLPGGYPDFAI